MKLFSYELLPEEDQAKARDLVDMIEGKIKDETDVDEEDVEDMAMILATNFAVYGPDDWPKLYAKVYKDVYDESPEFNPFEEETEPDVDDDDD